MGFHCQQHLRHCCLMVWIVSCPSPFTFRTHNEEKDVGVIAMDPLGLLASCFRYCSKWMLYGAIAHEWLVGSGGLWSGVVRFYFSTSFVCHASIQSRNWMDVLSLPRESNVFLILAPIRQSPLMSLELFQLQNQWILLAYDDFLASDMRNGNQCRCWHQSQFLHFSRHPCASGDLESCVSCSGWSLNLVGLGVVDHSVRKLWLGNACIAWYSRMEQPTISSIGSLDCTDGAFVKPLRAWGLFWKLSYGRGLKPFLKSSDVQLHLSKSCAAVVFFGATMFAAPTDWKYKQLIFISSFCEKLSHTGSNQRNWVDGTSWWKVACEFTWVFVYACSLVCSCWPLANKALKRHVSNTFGGSLLELYFETLWDPLGNRPRRKSNKFKLWFEWNRGQFLHLRSLRLIHRSLWLRQDLTT